MKKLNHQRGPPELKLRQLNLDVKGIHAYMGHGPRAYASFMMHKQSEPLF